MGSYTEFNDTLRISKEQGFPSDLLNINTHVISPIKLESIKESVFCFNKKGIRLYHPSPTRCLLVQDIGGKWLYWGHVIILKQTINCTDPDNPFTYGEFQIIKLYNPNYQKTITAEEAPDGLSFY